jgi:hypothetical protein
MEDSFQDRLLEGLPHTHRVDVSSAVPSGNVGRCRICGQAYQHSCAFCSPDAGERYIVAGEIWRS